MANVLYPIKDKGTPAVVTRSVRNKLQPYTKCFRSERYSVAGKQSFYKNKIMYTLMFMKIVS